MQDAKSIVATDLPSDALQCDSAQLDTSVTEISTADYLAKRTRNAIGVITPSVQPRRLTQILTTILLCFSLGLATQPDAFGQTDEEDMQGYGDEYGDEYGDDMDMNDGMEGYGDEYGGSGGGQTSRRGSSGSISDLQPNPAFVLEKLNLKSLTSVPMSAKLETGPILQAQAKLAFKGGNLPLALQLQYAHMVAEYDEATQTLGAMRYSKLFREPTWQLRWGVSMAVRGEPGGDMGTIVAGTGGKTISRSTRTRGGRGDGGGDDYGQDMEDEGYGDEEMEEQGYGEEMDDYGEEMADYGNEMQGGRPPARATVPAPMQLRSTLDPEVRSKFEKSMGLVAIHAAKELTSRFNNGDYGLLFNELPSNEADEEPEPPRNGRQERGGPPPPTSIPNPAMEDFSIDEPGTPMWTPGVVYLGEGDSKDTILAAQKNNLNVMLHFDVFIKPGRNDEMDNITRCRLYHVPSGKSMGTSKAFDSSESNTLGQTRGVTSDGYVADQANTLLSTIDRQLKLIGMPPITSDVAKKRVTAILSGKGSRSLQTLAEIRYYQMQGLITEADVEQAFDIVGGDEALVMLHGTTTERREVASRWAQEAGVSHGVNE